MIVSDSSPLLNLAAIGRLDLLRALFGHIVIPPAVYAEVVERGAGRPGSSEVRDASWVEVRRLGAPRVAEALLTKLDVGEAEAIALASELGATRLLIDEHRGREAARREGVPTMGLLGVLVLAKERGEIAAVKPCLDEMIQVAGFRLHDALYNRVLEQVKESPK